jgi:glutathionylspermidine synthase
MVSSVSADEIYTPFPYYLDRGVYEEMVRSTVVLDGLVRRLTEKILSGDQTIPFYSDEFPFKTDIFRMELPLPAFFWIRFDAFQREGGGIFFSEFNYDKPCAQREIAVCSLIRPENSPNGEFAEKFRNGLRAHWESFRKEKETPVVAILVDPGHYEELHLAYLFSDFLKPLRYDVVIAGGKNISVENGKTLVFGKKIDIILRQFPTESLYELPAFKDILELYASGGVLLLNDPRSIIGQAKSLFATLWEMVDRNDPFLQQEEIDVIRATIPQTRLFSPEIAGELLENKDKYVVKAVFGRFSEEVYIGKMHSGPEWEETIRYVAECEKLHIVQEFCQIKREKVLKFNGACYEERDAFGNFGVYLTNSSPAGISLRWSSDDLSLDDNVWIGSVGLRDRSIAFNTAVQDGYGQIWSEINDRMAFDHGYTWGFTGSQESFSLQPLFLDRDTYNELKSVSGKVTAIIKKTTSFVCENREVLCPALGIDGSLINLMVPDAENLHTFVGRYDWVMDAGGSLKLLEFNSETPAGLMESIYLNETVKERLNLGATDPNTDMKRLIRNRFGEILHSFQNHRDVRNVGIVSCTYGEDWYNTRIIYDLVRDMPYHFYPGEVSGLQARDGKLHLYGIPLDAVYRYYPLDWFEKDEYYFGVTDCLGRGTFSINPPQSLISQSKTFFALMYELMEKGFYGSEEETVIREYIPRTALRPSKAFKGIYCVKPILGREGEGVAFSFKEPFPPADTQNHVFQEWVDIQQTPLKIHSSGSIPEEIAYPVIGTYLIGDEFGGVYVRAGGKITDKWSVSIPVYIKE